MTREEHETLLQQIVNSNGDTTVMEAADRIRRDYDETLAYAENEIGARDMSIRDLEEERDRYKRDLDDEKRRYFDLWRRSGEDRITEEGARERIDEVKEDQFSDTERDGEKLTFDELFEDRERS